MEKKFDFGLAFGGGEVEGFVHLGVNQPITDYLSFTCCPNKGVQNIFPIFD